MEVSVCAMVDMDVEKQQKMTIETINVGKIHSV
jgi:hypothetical protein